MGKKSKKEAGNRLFFLVFTYKNKTISLCKITTKNFKKILDIVCDMW